MLNLNGACSITNQSTAVVASIRCPDRHAMLVTNAAAALANGYGCSTSADEFPYHDPGGQTKTADRNAFSSGVAISSGESPIGIAISHSCTDRVPACTSAL